MGKSLFATVFVVGIAVVAATTGCAKNESSAASGTGTASKSTEQIVKENPKLQSAVVARLESQIQQSNLPAEEKQRQIAKLRAEGPP